MHKSLSFFAAVACLAVAAFVVVTEKVAHVAVAAVSACASVVRDIFLGPVAMAAPDTAAAARPLEQARAFVLRLAKRERPVLTASWRMCPSI